MAQLSLANIVSISVAAAGAGAGEYNTSNVAIFSDEPYAMSFGSLGYNIYVDPTDVATDFGSDSQTYAMALAIFSQSPNILANQGYLVVIPFVEAKQDLTLNGIPASGTFTLNGSAAINWNDSAAQIQAKLSAVAGFSDVVVTGSLAGELLHVDFQGVYGPVAPLTVAANSLMTGGSVAITVTPSSIQVGETYDAAITRTQGLVQYFGCMASLILDQADTLAAAAVIQSLNKMSLFVSRNEADIEVGGALDLLRSGSFTQSRGLYYGSALDSDAINMMAAYAGRGFSTNFSGSNTTQNMQLKTLVGVQPDPSMTQAIYELAQNAGVDIYVSFGQGTSAGGTNGNIAASGANSFFDQVYNLQWFVGALQVAGFNLLAQVGTKIVQTDQGIGQLVGAYRQICIQAATNQYVAPGAWNSATTFGNLAQFIANISQLGFYLYAQPVAQQLQSDRAARKAPLIQIAIKEAGAVDTSAVIVNVNA